MMPTPSLKDGIDVTIGEVLHIEGAKFVDSLDEADVAVYVGNYLCDYEERVNMGETGYSAIMPLLYAARDKNLPLVVITSGRPYSDFCAGKCPEDKFMLDLIRQGRNINHIPLGYPYNRADCLV